VVQNPLPHSLCRLRVMACDVGTNLMNGSLNDFSPQRGDAYQRRVQPWKGPGTGMRSEGTPHKDGSDVGGGISRYTAFLQNAWTCRECRELFPRLHLGLVCVAPLGRVSVMVECLVSKRCSN
jgi:hypothetical protein